MVWNTGKKNNVWDMSEHCGPNWDGVSVGWLHMRYEKADTQAEVSGIITHHICGEPTQGTLITRGWKRCDCNPK